MCVLLLHESEVRDRLLPMDGEIGGAIFEDAIRSILVAEKTLSEQGETILVVSSYNSSCIGLGLCREAVPRHGAGLSGALGAEEHRRKRPS